AIALYGTRGRLDLPAPRPGARNESRITVSTLKERLHADVVVHMKDRNRTALTTVRNVLGEIETREKSGKTPVVLDDAQVTALLQKEAAKRRDTAGIYTEAGEPDRAAAEIAEAEVIEAYLPRPLTEAEVAAIVDAAIAELSAQGQVPGMRQMGEVMKPVTAKVAGRFDGKAVSQMVRSRLA
ncbi:MAG: glutamyl-tRNA amidotransferase, partial [Pseudarthrobacter sp.]|nr:glutamyl-tRNA amidotransferase [Pseudarthrobacter sp.]